MKYISIFLLLLSSFNTFCQEVKGRSDLKKEYYPKTNVPQTDSIKYWTYSIDYEFERPNDSIKPVGQIIFWRTQPINDKKSQEIYGRPWTPSISFDIYNIEDFEFCQRIQVLVNTVSSCLPPQTGGDLFIIKNYVFMNRSVCLNCIRYDNGIDYCRPTINKIFSELNLDEKTSLHEIDRAIETKIKRSE